MARPSVFHFAGGEPAFLALATAHHERCLRDPVLNHPFSHPGHPHHVERLAWYWAEVFGGPPRYSETCGNHSFMLEMHSRTGAEDELGSRFVNCFVQSADDAGLPADPEFRGVLRSYYGVGGATGALLLAAGRNRTHRHGGAALVVERSDREQSPLTPTG